MRTKEETEVAAGGLAQRLTDHYGKDFHPEVWENLGWCYAAYREGVRVLERKTPYHQTTYSALINVPGHPGGIWASTASTPWDAVSLALQAAGEEIGRKTNIWLAARDALGIQEGRLRAAR